MAQLTLSKSSMLSESRKLDNYQRFLPSLDLKRKQLIIERGAAEQRVKATSEKIQQLQQQVQQQMQMLGNEEIDLEGLVTLDSVAYQQENLLGISLPAVSKINISLQSYGLLTKPHWVDLLVKLLQQAIELRVNLANDNERLRILQHATRKATQRVNLVGKILIPQAQTNIRKIQIFLSDNERAAVVRSKIAKRKHIKQKLDDSDFAALDAEEEWL